MRPCTLSNPKVFKEQGLLLLSSEGVRCSCPKPVCATVYTAVSQQPYLVGFSPGLRATGYVEAERLFRDRRKALPRGCCRPSGTSCLQLFLSQASGLPSSSALTSSCRPVAVVAYQAPKATQCPLSRQQGIEKGLSSASDSFPTVWCCCQRQGQVPWSMQQPGL